MWFPTEIFTHIKDYMFNYKYAFSRKVLPLIVFEKGLLITQISPIHRYGLWSDMYEISYTIPRYEEHNISEDRLKKLGFTHYGLNCRKKDEKRYLYIKNKSDWRELDGYRLV
tara:strand:- start:49 stop:384 length:336 start_codon:yes stop_codon:yes gene_type:complete